MITSSKIEIELKSKYKLEGRTCFDLLQVTMNLQREFQSCWSGNDGVHGLPLALLEGLIDKGLISLPHILDMANPNVYSQNWLFV